MFYHLTNPILESDFHGMKVGRRRRSKKKCQNVSEIKIKNFHLLRP